MLAACEDGLSQQEPYPNLVNQDFSQGNERENTADPRRCKREIVSESQQSSHGNLQDTSSDMTAHPYSKDPISEKEGSEKICCRCHKKVLKPAPKASEEQTTEKKEECKAASAKTSPMIKYKEKDDSKFEQHSLDKIALIEAEMKSIGDNRNKRYQLLRKRRDGQKARMQMKLGMTSKEKEINLMSDVIKTLVSETQAVLTGAKRDAFNGDLVKALRRIQQQ